MELIGSSTRDGHAQRIKCLNIRQYMRHRA